jgi:motility quorum-sensing regulator/GCU-specific mRNA interferase toxin
LPDNSNKKPTYELSTIKKLLNDPRTRHITRQSYWTAVSLGYAGEEDIVDVVNKISLIHFFKTMESTDCPGLWQDVYRIEDKNNMLYVKIQLSPAGKGVVIQFKRK